MLNQNGLKLHEIYSEVRTIDKIVDLEQTLKDTFGEDGFVVAYMTDKILIGKYLGNSLNFPSNHSFDPRFLLRVRVFNQSRELLLWNTGSTLQGRVRIDGQGEKTYVVDAPQLLWGTDYEHIGNGYTRIFEQRGTELLLPLPDLRIDQNKRRVFIKTRNYIEFNPTTHLASYCDCRFIDFMTIDT